MITHFRNFAAAAAALAAAGTLSAQDAPRPCPNGDADQEGIEVNFAVLAHPTRVAATVDSVLRAQGYTVHDSPAGLGRWHVEPRFTWLPEIASEDWLGDEHPGVQLIVSTDPAGDSTRVYAGARALCNVPEVEGAPDGVGQMLEMASATLLAGGVLEALDTLQARGGDPTAAVERIQEEQGAVTAPPELAGFRLVDRHDYEDPAMGTSVRYGRDQDDLYLDVYVYPGVPVDEGCDPACAVNTEVDGFIGDFPKLVRAGYYEHLDVAADERMQPPAGAPWRYGRQLTMTVRRQGQELESRYWLYAMPGYVVKVRSTYPASPGARADVQAFADALPAGLVTERP